MTHLRCFIFFILCVTHASAALSSENNSQVGSGSKYSIVKDMEAYYTQEELNERLWRAVNSYDLKGTTKLEIMEEYIQNGANVNSRNASGLTMMHAVTYKDLDLSDIATILLQHGATINSQDRNGSTPLALACLDGRAHAVQFFLQNGADVNIADNNGNTPYDLAVSGGDFRIAEIIKAYE